MGVGEYFEDCPVTVNGGQESIVGVARRVLVEERIGW
jgi:hypothetical protein